MRTKNQVTLEFPSERINLEVARRTASAFVERMNPSSNVASDVATVVDEAVTNAVLFAYPDGPGKVMLRLLAKRDDVLEITVRDWGAGIADVRLARTPLFTTSDDERSGMGFTVMENFADEVRVRSTPGKGTTVVARKRIAHRSKFES